MAFEAKILLEKRRALELNIPAVSKTKFGTPGNLLKLQTDLCNITHTAIN